MSHSDIDKITHARGIPQSTTKAEEKSSELEPWVMDGDGDASKGKSWEKEEE